MERLKLYPRGYVSPLTEALSGEPTRVQKMNGVELVSVSSDPVIEQLYKLYMSRLVPQESVEFKLQVVQRCARIFGDFKSWLRLQVTANDNIYGWNLEFLKDTLEYIRTGQRKTSISTWQELLLEYPDPHPGTAGHQRMKLIGAEDLSDLNDVIGMWCSHKGGFIDMLCTAHVLFGVSKKPLVS